MADCTHSAPWWYGDRGEHGCADCGLFHDWPHMPGDNPADCERADLELSPAGVLDGGPMPGALRKPGAVLPGTGHHPGQDHSPDGPSQCLTCFLLAGQQRRGRVLGDEHDAGQPAHLCSRDCPRWAGHGEPGHLCTWGCPEADVLGDLRKARRTAEADSRSSWLPPLSCGKTAAHEPHPWPPATGHLHCPGVALEAAMIELLGNKMFPLTPHPWAPPGDSIWFDVGLTEGGVQLNVPPPESTYDLWVMEGDSSGSRSVPRPVTITVPAGPAQAGRRNLLHALGVEPWPMTLKPSDWLGQHPFGHDQIGAIERGRLEAAWYAGRAAAWTGLQMTADGPERLPWWRNARLELGAMWLGAMSHIAVWLHRWRRTSALAARLWRRHGRAGR